MGLEEIRRKRGEELKRERPHYNPPDNYSEWKAQLKMKEETCMGQVVVEFAKILGETPYRSDSASDNDFAKKNPVWDRVSWDEIQIGQNLYSIKRIEVFYNSSSIKIKGDWRGTSVLTGSEAYSREAQERALVKAFSHPQKVEYSKESDFPGF